MQNLSLKQHIFDMNRLTTAQRNEIVQYFYINFSYLRTYINFNTKIMVNIIDILSEKARHGA